MAYIWLRKFQTPNDSYGDDFRKGVWSMQLVCVWCMLHSVLLVHRDTFRWFQSKCCSSSGFAELSLRGLVTLRRQEHSGDQQGCCQEPVWFPIQLFGLKVVWCFAKPVMTLCFSVLIVIMACTSFVTIKWDNIWALMVSDLWWVLSVYVLTIIIKWACLNCGENPSSTSTAQPWASYSLIRGIIMPRGYYWEF